MIPVVIWYEYHTSVFAMNWHQFRPGPFMATKWSRWDHLFGPAGLLMYPDQISRYRSNLNALSLLFDP